MPVPGYDYKKSTNPLDVVKDMFPKKKYFIRNIGISPDKFVHLYLQDPETGTPEIIQFSLSGNDPFWHLIKRNLMNTCSSLLQLNLVQRVMGEKGGILIEETPEGRISSLALFDAEGHPGIGSFVDGEVNLPQVVPLWATT